MWDVDVQCTSREGTAFSIASFYRDDERRMDTRAAWRDTRLLAGVRRRSRKKKGTPSIGDLGRCPRSPSVDVDPCVPPFFSSSNRMQRRRTWQGRLRLMVVIFIAVRRIRTT
jgi:hypothetical protein